jgi:hypothetical protein
VLLPEHCCQLDADDWDESSPVGAVAAVDGGGSRSSDGVPAVVADGDGESHLSVADREEEVTFNFAIFLRKFSQESSDLSQKSPKMSQNCKTFWALQRDASPRQVAHANM